LAVVFKRERGADGCRLHPGQYLQSRQQLLRKRSRLFRHLKAVTLRLRSQALARVEACAILKDMCKAADQEARAGEQKHGKRDLRDEQDAAQPPLLAA
jgi:hypothetical protein